MPSTNMCSAKEGMDHGTHPPNYREIASHASFVLWSQDRQGQNMEFSSRFITGLWFRAGWERARVLAATLDDLSSSTVAPFASFHRSSVGCISSSASDFELAHIHCADGAVTAAGL